MWFISAYLIPSSSAAHARQQLWIAHLGLPRLAERVLVPTHFQLNDAILSNYLTDDHKSDRCHGRALWLYRGIKNMAHHLGVIRFQSAKS